MSSVLRLNKYFSRREFRCNCGCSQDTVDAELLMVLTDVRMRFKKPVTINSANRCPDWNRYVGGSPTSMHLTGKASDIVVRDVPAHLVAQYLESRYPNCYGIGRYKNFTHLDVRPERARWGDR